MNMTYHTSTTVNADQQTVAQFFAQSDMRKDYFPEVVKDCSEMGTYVKDTHANPALVAPDYMVADEGFGWTTGAGTSIRLPNKEIPVTITAMEVEYVERGDNTQIDIQVTFDTALATSLPKVLRCIRAMMNAKTHAFDRDIDVSYNEGWEPCFA